MLSNFLFSKPKNVENAKCRLTIDRVSTNYWPIHRSSIDQLSTNYRRSIGEVSAKCRRKVGKVSVNEKLYRPRHIWNDYRPCLDRVSTHYRPTIDRLSTAISTDSYQVKQGATLLTVLNYNENNWLKVKSLRWALSPSQVVDLLSNSLN